jgi:predicted membrane metal-binding protein
MPPALVPALALLAGAAVGASTDVALRSALPILPILCAASAVAWWWKARWFAWVSAVSGFGFAAAILATDTREHALHPPLRTVLEQRVGGFLIESLGPENDHEPIIIRAELIEDAAVREDYVSLRARVTALEHGGRWEDTDGGISLTVSGEAAAVQAREWRAGRTIEAPATFRRAARYLNTGVADFERQLALDGTTLLGSIKSALLVDVVARGSVFQEWAAAVRAHVRSAVARWVAPHDVVAAAIVTAVLIGDRTGLPDTVIDRLQRAGTYHVIAISGGAFFIEVLLVYPGIGLRLFKSIEQRDYTLMQGIVLLLTVSVVIANVIADLLYAKLDPRIGRAGGAGG